jgi:ubiquinone/menaquinone biosynthesis C-methylase UbiE
MTSPRSSGLRRTRVRFLMAAGRIASRILRVLPADSRLRRSLLRQAWAHLPADMLDAYLIAGYQNPRINVPSVLLRHELIRDLTGDRFGPLMSEELRFAVDLNEVLRARAAELGVRMGTFIDPAKAAQVRRVDEAIAGRDDTFMERWSTVLAEVHAEPVSVLEFACGSANDYRSFVESGLARLLDYRGVDLTPKNIANARRRFPGISFEVGDITALPYPDGSCDCVIASDIFEHLPAGAIEQALDEAARLARDTVVLTFFNMADIPAHEIREKGAYNWNTLSRSRVVERLGRHFRAVEAISVARFLADRFDYPRTYNRNAWTVVARRDGHPSPQRDETPTD